jgi:LmbE family N-acetylglucosaminyl deacetylase
MNNPIEKFGGTIAFAVPHMDDEALGCGGLIAKLPQKERIHLIYATDGMASPSPIVWWRDSVAQDLSEVRVRESISAMKELGVAEGNLHFFKLPEGRLKQNVEELRKMLRDIILKIAPDNIFVPFRYDRHPDHLVLNRLVVEANNHGLFQSRIIEYFVYHRWRLLPLRDIRKYVKPQDLIEVKIDDVAGVKRRALDCYKSQTSIFYPWQSRPILTQSLLEEECRNPEYFLLHDASFPGAAVFKNSALLIRIVHRIEPHLHRWKYLAGAWLKRLMRTGF